MSVFPSKGSARRTNPESRCGRSPTVVRITRSHDARTGASAIGGRRSTDTLRRERVVVAHPPKPPRPKPATASPALSRKFRLFIAIVSDARQSGFSHTPASALEPGWTRAVLRRARWRASRGCSSCCCRRLESSGWIADAAVPDEHRRRAAGWKRAIVHRLARWRALAGDYGGRRRRGTAAHRDPRRRQLER